MNKFAIATCLAVFTCTVSLPVFAFKTAPTVSKVSKPSIVATKMTKKSKKVSKVSLNKRGATVISCGKK